MQLAGRDAGVAPLCRWPELMTFDGQSDSAAPMDTDADLPSQMADEAVAELRQLSCLV